MGSYNVKCQVSGYTIKPNNPVVGFFVQPAPEQDDGRHRPDSPLHSLFQQRIPVHLPIIGVYGDYGSVFAKDPDSPAVNHAKSLLAGFDFSESQWGDFGAKGLAPGFEGPFTDRHSPLHLWQIRKDVYDYLVTLGSNNPDSLSGPNEKTISNAFRDIDPNSVSYKEAKALFTGLEIIGHGLRKSADIASQDNDSDNEIRRLLSRHLLTDTMTDHRPPAALPGGCLVGCGLTGRPILEGESVLVFPLIAQRPSHINYEESSGPLEFVTDHSVDAHYTVRENGIHAQIHEQGAIIVQGSSDTLSNDIAEQMTHMLYGYTEEKGKKRVSSMVVSKTAFDLVKQLAVNSREAFVYNGKSLAELLVRDYKQMQGFLTEAQSAYMSQDMEKIESFLCSHGMDDMVERLKSRPNRSPEDISYFSYMVFSNHQMKRVKDPDCEYGRSNYLSRAMDHSGNILNVESLIRVNGEVREFILEGKGSIDSTLDFLLESVVTQKTLDHVGVALNATEPRKVSVDPSVTLKAWSDIQTRTFRSVGREIEAHKRESGFDF